MPSRKVRQKSKQKTAIPACPRQQIQKHFIPFYSIFNKLFKLDTTQILGNFRLGR